MVNFNLKQKLCIVFEFQLITFKHNEIGNVNRFLHEYFLLWLVFYLIHNFSTFSCKMFKFIKINLWRIWFSSWQRIYIFLLKFKISKENIDKSCCLSIRIIDVFLRIHVKTIRILLRNYIVVSKMIRVLERGEYVWTDKSFSLILFSICLFNLEKVVYSEMKFRIKIKFYDLLFLIEFTCHFNCRV